MSSKKNKKYSPKRKPLSKKSIIVLAVVIVLIIAAMVWYFCFGAGKAVTIRKMDVSADTTSMLVTTEDAISGGTTQEFVDSFNGDAEGAIFTVNGEPVDAGIIQFAVNDFGMKYAGSLMMTGSLGDIKNFDWNAKDPNYNGTFLDYVKYETVEKYVPRYALIAEGKRRGITLTDEDKKAVESWCKEQQKAMNDTEFENVLRQNGCPDIETYIAFRELSVLEKKVYDDYEKNPGKYATYEQLVKADERELVTVKHILVAFNPENPSGEYTDEMKVTAKRRCEAILARVNAGEDFAALAEECTDDVQTDYTFAADEDFEQRFKDVAFSLEVGENSGLVETAYGYHIIKRYDRAVSITDYLILLNKNAKVIINKSIFDKLTVNVDIENYLNNAMQSMSGK